MKARKDDSGSLSLLIATLFFVLLILSFLIIDVASAYLAKRELIQIGEAAIQTAAHSVDLKRYYANDNSIDHYGRDGLVYRMPIDCEVAHRVFSQEIESSSFRNKSINNVDWSCASDVLHSTIVSKFETPLRIPLLSSVLGGTIEVQAQVGATSLIRTT